MLVIIFIFSFLTLIVAKVLLSLERHLPYLSTKEVLVSLYNIYILCIIHITHLKQVPKSSYYFVYDQVKISYCYFDSVCICFKCI